VALADWNDPCARGDIERATEGPGPTVFLNPAAGSTAMPIYEYICDDCGHAFELLIRGGAEPACTACESAQVTKQLSLPKVQSSVSHDKAMRAAKKRDQRMNAEQTRARIEYELAHDD